jgi:PAS domain S-box-containing protein
MMDATHEHESGHAAVDLDRFFVLSNDMLCIAGFDGYFKRVNPAWERVLGWTPEELTSRPWTDFVHPDDLDATIAEADKQTELGLEVISFENRYRARDGSYRWLLWNSRPTPEHEEMLAVARDITDRKEAEQSLRTLNESLEQLVRERTAAAEERAEELARRNAELEAFTYSVSHDLKEPLRTIEAFSQFVLEDYAALLDDQGRRYLETLASASVRLKRLIEELLTLSRVSRQMTPPRRVDTRQVVAAVIDGVRASRDEKSAMVDVVDDLPDVSGDPVRLEQIFGNLISNALKFNDSDDARVTIGVRDTTDNTATFYVRDNGIGIEPQYHERIFGVFQRLHRREEYDGTGAGLAIVKRAVQALGGSVSVESALGAGSTFVVTLPVWDGAQDTAQAA